MGQAVGELAVIGHDHQAGAVLIQPADRIDPLGDLGEEIDDPGPARRVEVGGHVTLGLVDGEVDDLLKPDRFAIDGDPGLGVYPGAELADDLAIDGDTSLKDVFLAAAARAQTRLRQDLLKPLSCVSTGFVLESGRGTTWFRPLRLRLVTTVRGCGPLSGP